MHLTQRGSGYAVDARMTLSVTEDMDTGFDFPVDDTIDVYTGGLKLASFGNSATGTLIDLDTNTTTLGTCLDLRGADKLTYGTIIDVASNASGAESRSLVRIVNDNPTASNTRCLELHNDSWGTTMRIDHTGSAGQALIISSGQALDEVIDILTPALTTGTALRAIDAGQLSTGHLAEFKSDSQKTDARSLVKIQNDHASATSAMCLELVNNSTSDTLHIDHNGTSGNAMKIDGEQDTGTMVNILPDKITTGKALDISNADAITQGTLVDVHSNSADTGTRSLMRVVNDNPSATNARCLELRNDSTSTTFVLDHNGASGQAFAIDSEQTAGEILDIVADTLVTGTALNIDSADALTSGTLASFSSNSADNTSRALVKITNDNTEADATNCLQIHQDGAGGGILFTGTGGSGINFAALGATGRLFEATATTDSVSANPESQSETGWVKITIGGVNRYIPFYTA